MNRVLYHHIDAESICLQINVMGTKAGDADLLTFEFDDDDVVQHSGH